MQEHLTALTAPDTTSIWVHLQQAKNLLFSYFLCMNLKTKQIDPTVHTERENYVVVVFSFFFLFFSSLYGAQFVPKQFMDGDAKRKIKYSC